MCFVPSKPPGNLLVRSVPCSLPNCIFCGQYGESQEQWLENWSYWLISIGWWMLGLVSHYTQQNSYSISHLLGTVTTWWLHSDSDIDNCWQHGDWAANGSVVIVLPAVNNSDYSVTVQSLCSNSDWWNGSFAVYMQGTVVLSQHDCVLRKRLKLTVPLSRSILVVSKFWS